MMTKLREMTFIFIWILVIAFVALMVFEWGMDFTGIKRRSNVVGVIDGNKITIQEFQKALQNAYMQEKDRTGEEPDDNKMRQLRDQVWETYVQRILFAKEIKKRDIRVTDHEVFLNLSQNPPAELRQNPDFQTDGQFDMAKYREALQNPKNNWLPVENYYRETLPYQKLQGIITSAVVVTDEEVRADYMDKNLKAKIEYLQVPVSAFVKDSVSASEKEIKDYYQAHKDDYKVEEKRKLNYVLFSTDPSKEDTAKVYELANDILKQAKEGKDFSQLADEYSEDPSVTNNHGDLGYFEKERMVPEFSEAAFSAKPGEIAGPVKTQFGLHIIKVIDKKIVDGKEQVHAAHILLKFSPGALTIEDAQNNANTFAEQAQDEGFKVAADKLKYEVKQTPEFGQRNFIPGLGSMSSAIRWTFKADKNDVSRVYRNNQGYVVLELAEISPEGYRPLEDVRAMVKNRVEQQKRMEIAKEYAQTVQAKLAQNESFQEIAKAAEDDKAIYDSTAEFSMSQSIPKVGRAPAISAAAFTLEKGKVSQMIGTERGYYFIKIIKRDEFDEKAFESQRESLRSQLLNQKTQKFFSEWYENLKEKADIEDKRDQFFTS
jgi:peptidyl-prolyl cis-trans isomerase D